MAKKGSRRVRTIFDEAEDQKDNYLSLSFSEILSDIKEQGFFRQSPGYYLAQDIIDFRRSYSWYLIYEYMYSTKNNQSEERHRIKREAARFWSDLDALGRKLAPWFVKHPEYKEAAELFARQNPGLNKAYAVPDDLAVSEIQDEKDYAFMAAAGCGLRVKIEDAKNEFLKETYGLFSKSTKNAAGTLKQRFARDRMKGLISDRVHAPKFLDSLLSQNNKPTKSLKGDIVRAVARALSEFFLFEGSGQGRPDTSVITSLAEFAGVTISPRMVRREIRKLLSP